MRRATLLLVLCAGCLPVTELGPSDAMGSLVFEAGEAAREIHAVEVDGDGLGDLLVRTETEDGVDTVYLFLGTDLVEGTPLGPEEAHGTFRGAFDGIDNVGDTDGDGRDAISMGSVIGWAVYQPDDLLEPGTYVAMEAPHRIVAGKTMARVLRVTGADLDGDGRSDLVAAAVEEGYDCGWLCGYWRPREHLGWVPGNDVARRGEQRVDRMALLSRAILDLPSGGYSLAGVGDLDGNGDEDVASGGQRNVAAVTLDTIARNDKYEVADKQIQLADCYTDIPMQPCKSPVTVEAAGDVDGDGRADLLVAIEGQDTWLVQGEQLSRPRSFSSDRFDGEHPSATSHLEDMVNVVGMGDVDGDGLADLAGQFEGGVSVFLSRAKLNRPREAIRFVGFNDPEAKPVVAGDVDGDGSSELALIADGGAWVSLMAPAERLMR